MRKAAIIFCLGIMAGIFLGAHVATLEVRQEPNFPVRDTLTDWQKLQMAIIFTESKGNPNATGSKGDAGILQIMPIYVDEANRLSGFSYSYDDAYDIVKSLEMFSIVQSYRNPEQDTDIAINLHNPRGNSLGYSNRVKRNLVLIERMENVREAIKTLDL